MPTMKNRDTTSDKPSVWDSIKYGVTHPFGLDLSRNPVTKYASGISDKEKQAEKKAGV